MTKPVVEFPAGELTGELQVRDLIEGDGATAQAGQQVVVHYVGLAHSTGEEFDASYNRNSPFSFRSVRDGSSRAGIRAYRV